MTITFLFELGPKLLTFGERFMALFDEFTALVGKLETDVAAVLQEIQDLKAQIAKGGMSEDQEKTIQARLQALSSVVEAAKEAPPPA